MKTESKQKKDASNFFFESRVSANELNNDSVEFISQLRNEVLEDYLTYYSKEKMNNSFFSKRFVKPLLALSLLVFVGLGAFLFTNNKGKNSEPDNAKAFFAEITFSEGEIEYKKESGGWFSLEDQSTVAQGDSIRVLGEGRAIVQFDDGSAVRLNKNTQVAFTSLDPKNILITQDKGEVYSRVVKADRDFVVQTEAAQYKSLGTAFKTIADSDLDGVLVFQSSVSVEDKESKENTVVKEGEKFFVKSSEDKKDVKKIEEKELEGDFLKWNKQLDEKEFGNQLGILKTEKKEEQKKEEKKPEVKNEQPVNNNPAPASASISLGGHADEYGISLNWVPTNLGNHEGYKVVWSHTNTNPTFNVDQADYVADSNAKTHYKHIKDGKTYYFRVCRYVGGNCDTYSNTMTIKASGESNPINGPISINFFKLENTTPTAIAAEWSMVNGTAPNGFKIVYSKSPNPTLENSNSQYIDQYGGTYKILSGLSSGTYYVRICRYTGSTCDIYSNQLTATVN